MGRFEIALAGPTDGNPFLDVEFSGRFARHERGLTCRGSPRWRRHFSRAFSPETPGDSGVTKRRVIAVRSIASAVISRWLNRRRKSRAGACDEYFSFRLRRWHALQRIRHDVLSVECSKQRRFRKKNPADIRASPFNKVRFFVSAKRFLKMIRTTSSIRLKHRAQMPTPRGSIRNIFSTSSSAFLISSSLASRRI